MVELVVLQVLYVTSVFIIVEVAFYYLIKNCFSKTLAVGRRMK